MMNHPASPPRGPEVTEEKEAASGNVAGISVSSATRNTGNGCLNGDRTEKDSSGRGLCGSSEAGGSAPWDVLTNEMKRYEYEISAAGRISYNACLCTSATSVMVSCHSSLSRALNSPIDSCGGSRRSPALICPIAS